jgi:hypothetical protein
LLAWFVCAAGIASGRDADLDEVQHILFALGDQDDVLAGNRLDQLRQAEQHLAKARGR